jgi:hypothetical protein
MAASTIVGRIEAKDGNADASLEGYRVEVAFSGTLRVPPPDDREGNTLAEDADGTAHSEAFRSRVAAPANGRDVSVEDRASALTDASGRFELVLPEGIDLTGPDVRFLVAAPSGRTVADVKRAVETLHEAVVLPADVAQPVALDRAVLTQPADVHVAGRVIDTTGKSAPPGMQVTIFARRAGEAEKFPVLAVRTDRSGAFFGDVPNVDLDEAVAVVEGTADPVPVPLESGRMASRILLPASLPERAPAVPPESSDDCGCNQPVPRTPTQADILASPGTYSTDLGTGDCVQFNVPNRAIEEFDFYSVVRTTEPDVRVLGLDDPSWMTEVPSNGAAYVPVVARAYDVELETRETGDPGVVQVSLVTADGRSAVVFEKASADAFAAVGVRIGRELGLAGEAEDMLARTGALARESHSVTENTRSVDAVGLDLRSVRQVLVSWPVQGHAWGLGGIGITATTEDGDQVPILIDGDEMHRLDPRILFSETAVNRREDWIAPAVIADALVPRLADALAPRRALARVVGNGGVSEHRPIGVRPDRTDMFLPAHPGRSSLSADNPADWDSTPTLYEAATVAHGHLLHFKQVWYADGYSLGDLLYSLPLAPGQKKLVSVTDWERREQTARSEETTGDEGLNASIARTRDLGEVVTGALTESVRGGSRNTTTGAGLGTGAAGNGSYEGFNFGALLGVSGGYGDSDSGAWQDSSRGIATNSLQTLRDNTVQSASAVRSLRSTVVQTVSQGESTRVTTEVVANHNHCHALTIEYFEVLRHLKVTHELADVRECLFVPLPISAFDPAKTLRWRQALETYLTRPALAPAFDAVRRVETNWSEVDYPLHRYADEKVISLSGEFELTLVIPLPPLPPRPVPRPQDTLKDTADAIKEATNPTTGFLGVLTAIATGGASLIANQVTSGIENATKASVEGARALAEELAAETSPQAQYEKFQQEVMPGLVAGFVDQLELYALVLGDEVRLPSADFTLVSEYRPGTPLLCSVKATVPSSIKRADIQQIRIKSMNGLPSGCRAIVNTANFRYRTSLFEHPLVDDRSANDDIDLPVVQVSFVPDPTVGFTVKQVFEGMGASVATPIDSWEQRNPRTDDRALAASLIDHLNEHLEFYHHAIWWTMDPNRRYLLLDGFVAPGSGNRSIASVVENRLIGIVGNSLVLPVANGVHLDPRIQRDEPAKAAATLKALYDIEPVAPARVSLPTRGVFAEAVMGNCNACETIDDSRFWRWEESPIDEPPAIEPASTATRRSEPADVTSTTLPTPIVGMQTPPAVPDPATTAALLQALGKQSFADITGLAGTQANAAAAYSKALDTALAFGKEASTLAQQAGMQKSLDKTIAAIDKNASEGKISQDDAKRLRTEALEKSVSGTSGPPKTPDVKEKLNTIKDAKADDAIDQPAAKKLSETVLKSYVGDTTASVPKERDTAADLIAKLDPATVTRVETGDPNSGSTVVESDERATGGRGGTIRELVADLILGASSGVTMSPLVEFDPDAPSANAQAVSAKMAQTGEAQQKPRRDDYVARFGLDNTKPEPIRSAADRQPWLGILDSDLDAVLIVANTLGVKPEHVLAVWISEGKSAHEAMLHPAPPDNGLENQGLGAPPGDFDQGGLRAFARSVLLFKAFGLDAFAAMIPHGLPNGDNQILGPDANHNAAFDAKLAKMRAAGVGGMAGRTNQQIREYFTLPAGGLRVVPEATSIDIGLRRDSLASWLWLQAGLFEVYRRDTEQQLFDMYGAGAVDLTNRPWVTYLRWNGGAAAVTEFLSGFVDQEAAIDHRFGANPDPLPAAQLTRYYAAGGSTAALANSIIVKYLVESVEGWFA